ncbi:MAG: hypothetical protein JSU72_14550 [Deltaproteobacteria bacterium]|nr:MAG: hypothetical protein JSU72_14550 [Deltaproteobacteria bacterium]
MKPGISPKDFSKWLHGAFDLRQRSDYSPEYRIPVEEVEGVLRNATSFVAEVKTLLAAELD